MYVNGSTTGYACRAARIQPYLSLTSPAVGDSSNGWQLASSTGNLTPRVVLTQPPPGPATDRGRRRFNARTVGWTGVSLRCWSWPIPGATRYRQAGCSRSPPECANKDKRKVRSCCSFLRVIAQSLSGLWLLYAKAAGKYLMNRICNFQGSPSGKSPLTIFAVEKGCWLIKKLTFHRKFLVYS